MTDIVCRICNGTKINPNAHPSHHAKCGACFGTGLSTDPNDQPRNGTTITLWDGEPLPAHMTVHHKTPTSRNFLGKAQTGVICLVSWKNPNYKAPDCV